MTPEMKHDLAMDGIRATPVAAWIGSTLAGMDWPALAAAAAFLYTMLLVFEKLWRWWVAPLFRNRQACRTPQDE